MSISIETLALAKKICGGGGGGKSDLPDVTSEDVSLDTYPSWSEG